ncbi:hypothetical protein ONS95_013711 [Cadophora gregata]|uniref:uncharacterized protein n=1 Tax=Cadophora gregata TaxID=51156 RepID=UPI0026DAD003|nr:uncharacterized protein ONS95_013711 [Cadophora gregata]KAK0113453.1 hypothetical protein ONS96_014319 [Cadophora gregata f. sp. sojae]KAK0114212.1 hypothetical protein ONS95_013711 [Cadophora gregata]
MANVDLPLVIVTLTGSLLSFLGTTFILICYLILPQKRHIRHALIINLTVADFINAANNSSSGLWVLVMNKPLRAGTGCTLNGFVGQLSVQAVDLSILVITIVTLWVVTSSRSKHDMKLSYIFIFCGCSWALPLITSGTALVMNAYGPAATNWCWINEDPVYLRYVLTHGWRFLIIGAVISMCIYIQVYLRRHSRLMSLVEDGQSWKEETLVQEISHESQFAPTPSNGKLQKQPPKPTRYERVRAVFVRPKVDPRNELMLRPQSKQDQQKSIQKAMLLHAYPIFYILLWLPGIAMRITQAMGHHSYVLQVMQASTQFIGFANAVTFGWNEKIGEQLKRKLMRRSGN